MYLSTIFLFLTTPTHFSNNFVTLFYSFEPDFVLLKFSNFQWNNGKR